MITAIGALSHSWFVDLLLILGLACGVIAWVKEI